MKRIMRQQLTMMLLLLGLSFAWLLANGTHVQAATLTVTKTADTNDYVCDADCSLREAIAAAQPGDTIEFAAPLFDTPQIITLSDASGFQQLSINKSLTVTGKGADLLTVRRSATATVDFRIFNIASGATVLIFGLTVRGGNLSGDEGGGIFNQGTLTLSGVHITDNKANDSGGGIANIGTLNLINSTVSNNTSGFGGGIFSFGGTLRVINSTISGNRASEGGGGIYTNGASTTITNATITDNQAPRFAGVYGTTSVTIGNSIIAGNGGSGTTDFALANRTSFTSQGYNLIGSTNGTFRGTGDQSGIDPRLYPLGNYGGGTPTHALRANSPAINPASSNNAPATDQRGVARPFGRTADIGAFEWLPFVTNTNDSGAGSLRQAVADVPAGGFVIFDPNTFGNSLTTPISRTIGLPSGQITINKSLSIVGTAAGALTIQNTAAASSTSRVFNITGGTVGLSAMTVTGGNLGEPTIIGGGGIFNYGNLTVFACHITANTDAAYVGGGGILNFSGAVLTIINSTVSNNIASNSGGGITNDGNARLTVLNSTVSGNRATGSSGNGGGILTIGNALIINSTITDNETNPNNGASAGGILKFNGTTVTIRNSIVAANCSRTTGALCSQSTTPDLSSLGGAYASQGYNLIGNVGAAAGFDQPGDQAGGNGNPLINPLLAPLAANDGPTPTHALLTGSPALDQGNCAGCSLDQRLFARPVDLPSIDNATNGDAADIGSFEAAPVICAEITAQVGGGGLIRPGQSATVTVTVSGGTATYTITLSNNGGTQSGPGPVFNFSVSPSATTTYSVAEATDGNDCPITAAGSATVTVDSTTPTIACPTNQTGVIAGTSGPVTYPAPTVSDNHPGAMFNCVPASGATFALGVTTVNCTARDQAGNTAMCSFTVTVRQPRPAIKDLIARVRQLAPTPLTTAQANGLIGHLELANTNLERGQTAAACTHLQNFVNGVGALVGGGQLTAQQGQSLTSYANKIRNAVGCTGGPFPT